MRQWLISAILISCLAGCGELSRYSKSGEISRALKKAIRDDHKQEVILKDLTHFNWDEFFVFDPYESTNEICKRLSLNPTECKGTIKIESTDDGEMLIAFQYKGKVVHVEMHFRWYGDFTPAPKEPFTPASAIFSVVADGQASDGRQWFRLRAKTIQKQP